MVASLAVQDCHCWDFIPCERVSVGFSSGAQIVCHLFSTAFPLESVSGVCPGRV